MNKPRRVLATDGVVPGVYVVGFHGQIEPSCTPARQGTVFADHRHRLVDFVQVSPGHVAGSAEVWIETGVVAPPAASLPGIGTRVGPWPARLGHYVAVVGPTEIGRIGALQRAARVDDPPRVARFLDWIETDETSSLDLECERLGGIIVAWHCAPDEGAALWARIGRVATAELLEAAAGTDEAAIRHASWRLQRAAVTDDDVYLAAAGLERARSPHVGIVLREGVRGPSEEAKRAGLDAARARLARGSMGHRGHAVR